jgi:hypothetical protein
LTRYSARGGTVHANKQLTDENYFFTVEEAEMAYYPPQMPLRARVYRYNQVLTEPPAVDTVCSLRFGWQGSAGTQGAVIARNGNGKVSLTCANTYLLFPRGTDLRRPYSFDPNSIARDSILVGATDGKLYDLLWWEDQWAGFPNEYRVAVVLAVNEPYWTLPVPSEYVLMNPVPEPAVTRAEAQRRGGAGR